MKTDNERGLIGAWARRSRMAEGLSVEQAVARLAAEGTAADASYVRAIESGSKRPRPDSDIVAALARAYRVGAPVEKPAQPQPAGDLAALIAALTEQTRQQTQLIALLTEQNAMLRRLLPAAPAPAESDPLVPARGPLPRLGLARAVRTLAAMESAQDTEAVPAPDPDSAVKRPEAR